MKIIFDENSTDTFQNKTYTFIELKTPEIFDFQEILASVRDVVNENKHQTTIILKPAKENTYFLLFAALLCIEGRDGMQAPGQAVFKVHDHKAVLEKYKPYFAFAVAGIYVLRLLELEKSEMYCDIKSLNYLGLDIKTDYQNNEIIMHLPNPGKKYLFKASNLENTVILSSFIKMISLLKVEVDVDITIVLKVLKEEITHDQNTDMILTKLYGFARRFLNADYFKTKA